MRYLVVYQENLTMRPRDPKTGGCKENSDLTMRYLVVYQENLTKRFSWYTTRFSWSIQKFIFTPPFESRGLVVRFSWYTTRFSWWDSLGTPWDSHGEFKYLFLHTPVLASRGLVVRISWWTTRFSWWASLGVSRDSHGQFILRGVHGLKCQCCKDLLQVSNFSCLLASNPSPTTWPYLLKKIEF